MYKDIIITMLDIIKLEIPYYEDHDDSGVNNENYIVYMTDISNTPLTYSDGEVSLRTSNCQIDVFTSREQRDYFTNLVETLLANNKVNYKKYNLGFNTDLNRMQTSYEFNLI